MSSGENVNIGDGISGALFEDPAVRRFRYSLWRIWNRELPFLLFIGLNPSTAGQFRDDPTIIRLVGFAKAWGFGGLFAGNLFSLVSPYPEKLWQWAKVYHINDDYRAAMTENDVALKQMGEICSKKLVGWGNEGQHAGTRPEEVIRMMGEVFCIRVTKAGEPTHPLYLPKTLQLVLYERLLH